MRIRLTNRSWRLALALLLAIQAVGCEGCRHTAPALVTYERLQQAHGDPGNWLTYSRTYDGRRFSPLAEIRRENLDELQLRWVFPIETPDPVETTPLVADGVMYLTRPPNDVVALDAATGAVRWEYRWPAVEVPEILCCGRINRGLALLGDTLYMGTIDARLVAIDAASGRKRWDVAVGDPAHGYTISAAPLVVKDLVITGTVVSQVHYGRVLDGEIPDTRGYIDAYDAATGALRWRFYTVPAPGEAGHETWGGESWREGRSSPWMTGSYDPELNLLYWGVGNPAPAFSGSGRPGDNLYSSSVVAIDPDSGELRWHFQFTPHDVWDWDAAQILVLTDLDLDGGQRRVLLNANRNGFFYALDRETGEFLFARPFARQTWASGFDDRGRPILNAGVVPGESGTVVSPNGDGATSWWSPSFSARTGLFYVTAHDGTETFFSTYTGGMPRTIDVSSAIRAIDARTGAIRWEVPLPGRSTAGMLTTAGDLLFSGNVLGEFFALDAATGESLWRDDVGGWVHAAPISYLANGVQHVSIASIRGVYTFAMSSTSAIAAPRYGWLYVAPADHARHVRRTSAGTDVRIEIDRAASAEPWHIQWNVERFAVQSGARYAVRFRGKADHARIVRVGFARAHGDRAGLGLYSEVTLDTAWRNHEVEFVAGDTEPRARIHFDVGGDPNSIDISEVELVERAGR